MLQSSLCRAGISLVAVLRSDSNFQFLRWSVGVFLLCVRVVVNWPPRAVGRAQSVVGLKGIKKSQYQDRCGVSWHYCH